MAAEPGGAGEAAQSNSARWPLRSGNGLYRTVPEGKELYLLCLGVLKLSGCSNYVNLDASCITLIEQKLRMPSIGSLTVQGLAST